MCVCLCVCVYICVCVGVCCERYNFIVILKRKTSIKWERKEINCYKSSEVLKKGFLIIKFLFNHRSL